MQQDTLYLKIDSNVEVHDTKIFLKDIAQLECPNREIENRVRALTWENAIEKKPGRYVKSVMEVIACIHKTFPQLEINNIGEADFIVTYEKTKHMGAPFQWAKTVMVCVLSFFGAGFSIMTFNNDVDVTGLFAQIYRLFTGQVSDGFTVLELSYSVGLGMGILLFFNHFAGKKLTEDPTPLEIQMRTYEDDVNNTLIETSRRKPKGERQGDGTAGGGQ